MDTPFFKPGSKQAKTTQCILNAVYGHLRDAAIREVMQKSNKKGFLPQNRKHWALNLKIYFTLPTYAQYLTIV
jgi:hypothetical protein